MEWESISVANNVTADTFNHTPNTQIENANKIFTSEKLDKLDDMEDALNDLTIIDAQYYESKSATASGAQGYPTCNPETVTHTRNRKEKVTDTSNGNFEQKLFSNQILRVVASTMKPMIYSRIVQIVLALQTLLTPETKKVVENAAFDGA